MDSGCSSSSVPASKDVAKERTYVVTVDSNIVFFMNTSLTGWIVGSMSFIMVVFLLGDMDGMSCMGNKKGGIDKDTFESFCWTRGTYIVEELLNSTVGLVVPYPGVGMILKQDTPIYYWAYPWFPLYFWFVSLSVRLTWWLWANHLGGANLIGFIHIANNVVMSREELLKVKNPFVDYLILTRHHHKFHAFKYSVCEVLNMVNLCLHVWFADWMMGGGFSTYGQDLISYGLLGLKDAIDPRIKYFPRVTNCVAPFYGPAGSIVPHDGICVMSLHILVDKMFAFLWFWYALLFIFNTIGLIYRITVLYCPPLRLFLLRVQSPRVNPTLIQTICKFSDYGDWYYIYSLRNSIKCWVFDEILSEYGERLAVSDGRQ